VRAIYLELAGVHDNPEDVSIAYSNAGLAFKRATDYGRSEECYVSGLFPSYRQAKSRSWHTAECAMKWNNLLCLYFLADRPEESFGKAEQCLLGLLHVVNLNILANSDPLVPTAKACVRLLVPRYRNAKWAKLALVHATSNNSVDAFRSSLSSRFDPAISCALVSVPFGRKSDKAARRDAKEEVVGPKAFTDSNNCIQQCFAPGCFVREGLLHCPCGTVHYCSKAYQRLHWRHSHKQNCRGKRGERGLADERGENTTYDECEYKLVERSAWVHGEVDGALAASALSTLSLSIYIYIYIKQYVPFMFHARLLPVDYSLLASTKPSASS
jgi:hypothetical protein